MIRFVLSIVLFYLLFRLIRRLLNSASEQRDSGSSRLQEDSPKKRYQDHVNDAEIEDATFEEIENDSP